MASKPAWVACRPAWVAKDSEAILANKLAWVVTTLEALFSRPVSVTRAVEADMDSSRLWATFSEAALISKVVLTPTAAIR